MKKITILLLAGLGLAFTLPVTFLESLKLTRAQAGQGVWNSFSYGAYGGPMAKAWHSIAAPSQLAMVKEIGGFARAYSESDDFKRRYAAYRENYKPNPPEPFKGVDVLRMEMHDALTKSIQESRETLKTVSGDARKAVSEAVKQMEAQLKEVDNPGNPTYSKEVNDMMKQGWDQQNKEYQTGLTAWEEQYPALPNQLIRKRLQYFLGLSSTVDFNAKVSRNSPGVMLFVNPEYEARSADWKLLYRCGRQNVEAARAIANQWLTELK